MNIREINEKFRGKSPAEIVKWAISISKRPIVTTNFRPYESAILHAVSSVKPDIPVIWCDSGYNTPYTYMHAQKMIQELQLNIDLYVPQQTVAYRNMVLGIPELDTKEHDEFTRQVKLEPFQRAMKAHQPDVWFTNLRKGQTTLRDSMDLVNQGSDGTIKVCPFYHWSDEELEHYLLSHGLETETRYYDPTKGLNNRECGLHVN